MEKKLLVVLVVVGLCSTAALALDPMGPATAGLKQGQFSAGLDGAYSEMDLRFDGKFTMLLGPLFDDGDMDISYPPISDELTFENVELYKAYLNIGYGVCDTVEVFVRLGGASAEMQKPTREIDTYFYDDDDEYPDGGMSIFEDGPIHDFDTGFAVGLGGKVTFWEPSPELKVGFLAQGSWTQLDVRTKYQGVTEAGGYPYGEQVGLWSYPADGQLEFWEVQLALGATYELSPKFTVYGGPFYHWFSGNYDFEGDGAYAPIEEADDDDVYGFSDDLLALHVDGSYDVDDTGCFGGYFGAKIDVTENASFNAECQIAEGAYAFGTGIVWKF
jgi:hypothetical protein